MLCSVLSEFKYKINIIEFADIVITYLCNEKYDDRRNYVLEIALQSEKWNNDNESNSNNIEESDGVVDSVHVTESVLYFLNLLKINSHIERVCSYNHTSLPIKKKISNYNCTQEEWNTICVLTRSLETLMNAFDCANTSMDGILLVFNDLSKRQVISKHIYFQLLQLCEMNKKSKHYDHVLKVL
jgi:hypothetical protein